MRKLHFIEQFIQLTDEKIITQMEALMMNVEKKQHEQVLSPMSMDEFRAMIHEAKLDAENGRTTSQENLKEEIKLW